MKMRAQIEAAPQGGYVLSVADPNGGFLDVTFAGSLEECIECLGAYFETPAYFDVVGE